jgi:hypothetical protein
MASLALLSVSTEFKPQSLFSGVDNFIAGAWSKHKKRLVDFISLLVFGIPLALVLITTRHPDNLFLLEKRPSGVAGLRYTILYGKCQIECSVFMNSGFSSVLSIKVLS